MRKTAVSVTVTTLVLGVFGAFLRWLQNTSAYDSETGCVIPMHPTSIVFLAYCVLAAAIICGITFLWLRRYDRHGDIAALRSVTILPTVFGWMLGVVFVLCACVIMFSAGSSRFPTAQRLLGAGGILGGLCFPFLFGKRDGRDHGLGRTAATVLTLFCCFWLVFSWRGHSENPVLWSYVIEVLAVAANAVAFYYIAAFHYGAGRSNRALLSVQFAVFFNVTTLFDTRSTAESAMFLLCVGMLLLTELILIENMWEKRG